MKGDIRDIPSNIETESNDVVGAGCTNNNGVCAHPLTHTQKRALSLELDLKHLEGALPAKRVDRSYSLPQTHVRPLGPRPCRAGKGGTMPLRTKVAALGMVRVHPTASPLLSRAQKLPHPTMERPQFKHNLCWTRWTRISHSFYIIASTLPVPPPLNGLPDCSTSRTQSCCLDQHTSFKNCQSHT